MLEEYGQSFVYMSDRGYTDINPVDCGWEHCRSGHSFGPTIRDYYLIHYVNSGCGVFQNERGEYSVKAGQMFVIRPGELTHYSADTNDPWNYTWVGFTGRQAKIFDGAPDVVSGDCRKYFDAMKKSAEYESMREEIITGQIFLLISELFGKKSRGAGHVSGFAARAANYIEYHYMQVISVEQIAHEMNIDRRYLSRLFKKEYGLTVQEYIISVRMRRAEDFLRFGYSVGQTAAMCGYPDVFNFSKMFKKHFGFSPSQLKLGEKL